jgi:hypothetical protein
MVSAVKPMPIHDRIASQAYRRVKPELDALAPHSLVQVNVEAQTATAIVLSALPRIRALRPQLVQELPAFDLRRFDRRLEDYDPVGARSTFRAARAGDRPAQASPLQCRGTHATRFDRCRSTSCAATVGFRIWPGISIGCVGSCARAGHRSWASHR